MFWLPLPQSPLNSRDTLIVTTLTPHFSVANVIGILRPCWVPQNLLQIEVERNSPLEDYFCHLSQNGINFLSRQVWLICLNKKGKSRRQEVKRYKCCWSCSRTTSTFHVIWCHCAVRHVSQKWRFFSKRWPKWISFKKKDIFQKKGIFSNDVRFLESWLFSSKSYQKMSFKY